MKTTIGVLLVVLLLFVSIVFSVLLEDFSFLAIGVLVDVIFIAVFFKPKLFSKKLFSRYVHHEPTHKEKGKLSFKFLRFDLSKVRVFSEKSTIFVLGIISFSYFAIFKYTHVNPNNAVLDYFESSFNFFSQNFVFLLIIPALIVVYFLFGSRNKRKMSVLEVLKSFGLITLSFVLSLLAVFLVGTIHVGAIGALSGSSSEYIIDTKRINEHISKREKIPEIILFDEIGKKELIVSRISKWNGESDFYEKSVINHIPSLVFSTIKTPDEQLFLYNDALVVKEINQATIESISPSLGRLIVRLGIPNKNIKPEPDVDVLNRQEYLKLREDQINEQLAEIDSKIDQVDIITSNLYGAIAEARSAITKNENGISSSISSRDYYYNNCKTAGYYSYYFGTFYRYYTDAQCESDRAKWDAVIVQYQSNISEWRASLGQYQRDLATAQEVKEYLVDGRYLVESQKQITPHELGLFTPEREIKVALDTTNKDYLKEYIATLIHEYLHYTSYVSEERYLEHSLEEGITEYLSRKITREIYEDYEGVGYPILVKLIEAISKKINDEDLLDIYFTKDQAMLEYLLDEAYGKNFYKDSEFYFQVINYLPPDKAIKVVNNILVRMGEKTITEDDL